MALDELAGEGARTQAGQAIVLLSDGDQTEDADAARAAGLLASNSGVPVYTIGLGADANADLLTDVAGSSSRTYIAPNADDLAGVYERIAAGLARCP